VSNNNRAPETLAIRQPTIDPRCPWTRRAARARVLAFCTVLVPAQRLTLALVLLSGCDSGTGPFIGGQVQPNVAPPTLAPVIVAPPTVDRSVVSQVVLRDPSNLAAAQTDTYLQSDGEVDILWIVDTTGSMHDELVALQTNFQRFIDTLERQQVKYHIGVTSTDMSSTGERGALRGDTRIIDNNTPDKQAVFAVNTNFDQYSRKRWTQVFGAMTAALSSSGPNAGLGFVRKNAALAVIAVTNADDATYGGVAYYARWLRSAKGPGFENLVTFSTIAGTLPDGCYPPGQSYFGSKADPPFRLADMTRRTAGVLASICDSAFDQSLVRIAQGLNTLRRVFPLTLAPDPTTIYVTVDGVPINADPVNGWQYRPEINSIAFSGDYVPPPGSTVRIFFAIKP
jgi:hypothetical protein